ncbi:MAG: oxaloacetate decarboxylase, alpha subunit/acetyl-CoA carboxylase biotin carboxyl carrier protein [Chloroflexi bacterium]|jgi:acetyl-CoA carboxylase biotin carboxyl carrier protein|nr:MAG: oxaloacetate decarboxylase, alpha subunit/acetyl-CoA carboxylase biotin carboxyl carrier protein [Chloroflexota bacterium]
MDLTEEDILQILDLIDKSSFDYFQLKMGDLNLTVSRGDIDLGVATAGAMGAPAPAAAAPAPAAAPVPAPVAAAPAAPAAIPTSFPEGMVPVYSPMVGTFYAAPEPSAPPFIELGGKVDEDTTMGLIEVMKVFNSIRSGANGVVAEILVQNAQFVEYGQPLFLIKPDGS